MDYLLLQSGPHSGTMIPLRTDRGLVIGRGRRCDVRLAAPEVSRKHCRLTVGRAGVTVWDLDSRNGTLIDGFEIRGTGLLRPGSMLTVGPLDFLLPTRSAPGAAPPRLDLSSWLTENGITGDVAFNDPTLAVGFAVRQDSLAATDLDRHPEAARAAEIIQRYWQRRRSRHATTS